MVIKLWGEPRWWIAEPIQVGQRGEKRGRKTQIFIWGTSEFYDAAEVDSGFGCSSRARDKTQARVGIFLFQCFAVFLLSGFGVDVSLTICE